jgi:uncharacterized sulfatase
MADRKRITRRTFVKGTFAFSTILGLGGALDIQVDKTNKPNIVFVFSDQQRWDTLGCYGQKLDITPNLDKMAREGVRFEYSFTCQPVCGPARAALQTGKYPTEVGCHTNHRMLPINEKTMAHYLSAAGYEVGYIGKWHLASQGPVDGPDDFMTKAVPLERRGGYKDFWMASDVLEFTSHSYDGYVFNDKMERVEFPKGRYRVDALTDFAVDYLKTRKQDKPFFLFISYLEPHHQNDHNHFEGPRGSKEKFGNYEVPGDLVGMKGDWQEEYPDYLGCVNSLDANLGRIRNTLKELELDKNTLVIYTSDHGCHFRTRNAEYKRSCHESSIRTPLVICGPGFEGGKVVRELVSLIDLTPTVLTAAGVEPPDYMRGRPLQDLVNSTAKDWPCEVFVQISESIIGRAIRTKKWKYSIVAPQASDPQPPGSDVYYEHFLYDLENDPYEQNNLVNDPALVDVRAELAEVLISRMIAVGEKAPQIKPYVAER